MNSIRSLSDLFNSNDAVINDPYIEIHTACQVSHKQPQESDYVNLLEDLDKSFYPMPKDTIVHHVVDPLHGTLKSVYK